jgi:hypothetical protein
MKTETRVQLLLSMQASLLDCVSWNIRGVTCGTSGKDITIKVFFDGPISEDDRDLMDEMATEVASNFKTELVNLKCIQVDAPHPYIDHGLELWAYRRKEIR